MVNTCTEELTAKELKSTVASGKASEGNSGWFNSPYYHFLMTLSRKLEEGRVYEVGRRTEGERDETELLTSLINKGVNTRKMSFQISEDNEEHHRDTSKDLYNRKRKTSTD